MENRHYSRRGGAYSHPSRRRTVKNEGNYFFIKVNICLGIVICTLAAVSMENDKVRVGCEKLANLISTNTSSTELANEGAGILSAFKGDGDIYTFAGEKDSITLSEEIKAEIESRSGVYERSNKGAPQKSGLFPLTE